MLLSAPEYQPGCQFEPDIEEAFLNVMMMQPHLVRGFAILPKGAFSHPAAQRIWEVLQTCEVENALGLRVLLSESDRVYANSVLQSAHFGDPGYWAKKIIELWGRREITRIAQGAIVASCRRSADVAATIEETIASLQAITSLTSTSETLISHGDAAGDYLEGLVAESRAEGPPRRLKLGWSELDGLLGGICGGQLVTIGARPSMGKSTLALNMAENIAAEGRPALFISLEMSTSELESKLLSKASRVGSDHMREARTISENIFQELVQGAERTRSLPIYFETGNVGSALDVKSKVLRVENLYGHRPAVVFIDYLQLIALDSGKDGNMNQAVSALTRQLKRLAMELDIPIVLLSQLNRSTEGRQDKRPTLSDLRDSGSIEQDSDIVIGLYRDAVYNQNSELGGESEVIILKNRGGKIGTARLVFDGQYSEFKSMMKRY